MKIVAAKKGYTLVELIITVAIFSLAFVAIAAIFIAYTMAQARASNAQRLLNEGSYILEAIARETRMNSIDYTCGKDFLTDHTYICLKEVGGKVVHFMFDATAPASIKVCRAKASVDCLNANNWSKLNPSFLNVTSFAFHVYPEANPFSATVADAKILQPMVLINMSISAGLGRVQQKYNLQTAVSSRVYTY